MMATGMQREDWGVRTPVSGEVGRPVSRNRCHDDVLACEEEDRVHGLGACITSVLGAAGEGGRWGPRAAVTWLGSAGPLGLREASAGFVSWGCDPGGQSGEARGLPKPRSPGSLPLSHQPKNHLAEPRVRMQGACRVSARMAWTQGGGQLGMPV